jgi:hypothetical protein
MHISMQFCYAPRFRHRITNAAQTYEVLARVLCHNMCVLIRATRELGVKAKSGITSGSIIASSNGIFCYRTGNHP